MTASAGAWYRVGKVSVVGGSQSIVGVDTNWQSDVIAIAIGDIFTLDAKTWYEVTAVNSDTSITLDRGFEGSTGTDKSYAILRNTSGTILTRIAGQVSVQFNQKQLFLDELRNWLNSTNASEELTDSHGLKRSLKTPAQMVADHDNRLAELDEIHPYPWAMRKVEFEANRKQNNEMFAASGFVHFGKHMETSGYKPVNQGLYYVEGIVNAVRLGRSESGTGQSKTSNAVVNMAGVVTEIDQLSKAGGFGSDIKLPPAEDGTRTYDSATGVSVTHATPAIAFASETATNKVVTDRVDMWGLEAYLREINDADPFVYANGLIQSLASDINGVGTVEDNVRPITYFAWYEGDDSSTGKGVNWQTATEAQRTAIASNPDNNIYFDDATGKFYQWCVRGRSFAGAGNGDWDIIDVTGIDALTPKRGVSMYLRAQGGQNEVTSLGSPSTFFIPPNDSGNRADNTKVGVWTGQGSPLKATVQDDQCYFLVCGTVNRLNKGAYHPIFNSSGTSNIVNAAQTGNGKWYQSGFNRISSKSQCFDPNYHRQNYGSIISPANVKGRPDGRNYDAIYASGQGGVCRDMRYSAWGLKAEDFAEADLKVKSGTYRGRELPDFTKAIDTGGAAVTSGSWDSGTKRVVYYDSDIFFEEGKLQSEYGVGYIISKVTGEIRKFSQVVFQSSTNRTGFFLEGDLSDSWTDDSFAILTSKHKGLSSTADTYTHTDVVGEPANILLCDDLKDGWVGGWIPVIPDGTTKSFGLSRKAADTPEIIETQNAGASWASISTGTWSDVSNSFDGKAIASSAIWLVTYPVKAVMTEDSINSKIYGGANGVGRVFVTSNHLGSEGNYLLSSLIGKVGTDGAYANLKNTALNLNNITLSPEGELKELRYSPWTENSHSAVTLVPPTNNSVAVKVLNYNVVENQQGFINFAYTELKYDGDWGDDGKINITDNQATRLDDNGNSAVYGTARIVEPLGWIKNDK